MTRAVCPGSFDPVTNGHVDIFRRASGLFDELIVATGTNISKSRMFDPEDRLEMLREACADLPNVTVMGFTGLIVDFCREVDAQAIVKGLRGGNDYEYELPMAQMNAHLTGVETVFVPTTASLGYVSSSLVKEVASLGGDVSGLVPDAVLARLRNRLGEHSERRAGQ
ncbi:MAG TPA: pantetheine-phosphate adenylyltransferase [Nocardioides sp.]|nr:pantetheine-phosphate adenylyltransferase [Nocardioides sp.]